MYCISRLENGIDECLGPVIGQGKLLADISCRRKTQPCKISDAADLDFTCENDIHRWKTAIPFREGAQQKVQM